MTNLYNPDEQKNDQKYTQKVISSHWSKPILISTAKTVTAAGYAIWWYDIISPETEELIGMIPFVADFGKVKGVDKVEGVKLLCLAVPATLCSLLVDLSNAKFLNGLLVPESNAFFRSINYIGLFLLRTVCTIVLFSAGNILLENYFLSKTKYIYAVYKLIIGIPLSKPSYELVEKMHEILTDDNELLRYFRGAVRSPDRIQHFWDAFIYYLYNELGINKEPYDLLTDKDTTVFQQSIAELRLMIGGLKEQVETLPYAVEYLTGEKMNLKEIAGSLKETIEQITKGGIKVMGKFIGSLDKDFARSNEIQRLIGSIHENGFFSPNFIADKNITSLIIKDIREDEEKISQSYWEMTKKMAAKHFYISKDEDILRYNQAMAIDGSIQRMAHAVSIQIDNTITDPLLKFQVQKHTREEYRIRGEKLAIGSFNMLEFFVLIIIIFTALRSIYSCISGRLPIYGCTSDKSLSCKCKKRKSPSRSKRKSPIPKISLL